MTFLAFWCSLNFSFWIFCCKPDLVCYVIGTEVNRSLACRLTLIWLAIRLCLKSVKTVGAILLQMPLVSLFCLFICFSPSWLQASLSAPLWRDFLSCNSFLCNSLLFYWSPVGVVLSCGKGECSIILQGNRSLLVGLCLGHSQSFSSGVACLSSTPFPGCSIPNVFLWRPAPCWLVIYPLSLSGTRTLQALGGSLGIVFGRVLSIFVTKKVHGLFHNGCASPSVARATRRFLLGPHNKNLGVSYRKSPWMCRVPQEHSAHGFLAHTSPQTDARIHPTYHIKAHMTSLWLQCFDSR